MKFLNSNKEAKLYFCSRCTFSCKSSGGFFDINFVKKKWAAILFLFFSGNVQKFCDLSEQGCLEICDESSPKVKLIR